MPAHGSGATRIATPSSQWTFTTYSLPVSRRTHSRCGLHTRAVTVFRDPLSEGFRHFVSSMPAPVASGWSESPGGACTHWKAPPFTAHPHFGHCLAPAHTAQGGKLLRLARRIALHYSPRRPCGLRVPDAEEAYRGKNELS